MASSSDLTSSVSASKLNKEIIPLSGATHLPTKLTDTNFPVWRKQLETTLFGYNLIGYVNGTLKTPPKLIDDKTENPEYYFWQRQDHFIHNAMLGSCVETIQPSISTVSTSQEAWDRLKHMYANKSRTRVLSLKANLIQNPRNNRSITEYMKDMRSLVDALSLADSPVLDEDLFISVITQLGPEYKDVTAALCLRETPIPFDELFDRLIDFENQLKKDKISPQAADTPSLAIPTANYTYSEYPTRNKSSYNKSSRFGPPHSTHSGAWRPPNRQRQYVPPNNRSPNTSATSRSFCHFCNRPNHTTKECRQLTRFLREHSIQPVANYAATTRSNSSPWLFDTGASHHVTADVSNLSSYSNYGGPEEIILGDGSGSSHGGADATREEFK